LFDVVHEVLAVRAGAVYRLPLISPVLESGLRLDGMRLLLVEDNALNQFVASGMLEQVGASVDAVGDGAQAVATLRTRAGHYDLVLMDIQMPVMDGFSATRVIRNELRLTLPIVAMTAGVTQFEREQCVAAGMDDIIAKPIDPERMVSMLSRLARPRSIGSAPSASASDMPKPVAQEGILELDSLLKLSASRPAQRTKLIELIRSTSERAGRDFQLARSAWQTGNIGAAARALHDLRGSVGSLGARRFAHAALILETALAANDAGAAKLFDAAEHELILTVAAAAAWLAEHRPG
jgi:CheY-like chemotaxis protein/HPt (histidine-containing phosphotransfer) domain-containing protein